ncbi:hypothetical protein NE237_019117 [Protea cynaroides]|uniref:Tr-type G domain-containing protein n=1 Tax=Protea cynaroides TaxID=273540 RepID=A0A9Q0KB45_9MAGN|nr:hypothetical protein NE237_019117 [Protea cynaroides]
MLAVGVRSGTPIAVRAIVSGNDDEAVTASYFCRSGNPQNKKQSKTCRRGAKGNNTPTRYDEINAAPEEHARDITITTTHVKNETDKLGLANYVKNSITDAAQVINDAAQVDGATLVVSGVDGRMPQTKKHILLA